MDNVAAFAILKKQKISKEDKKFLKTHLETYEYLLSSAFTEAYTYKDIRDKYNMQDSRFMSIKENVIILLEDLYDRLNKLKKLENKENLQTATNDLLYVLQHNELLKILQKE